MASKRSIKKQIRYICGDLAGECIMAKYILPSIDQEDITNLVLQIAELQTTALARADVSFDKAPRGFANGREYRKARRAYYKSAYKALRDGFAAQLDEVVKAMNAIVKKK